jgi:uncharacterized protein (TIGR02453 family)
MAYLEQDFLQFFMDLAGNNNKEWFDANRSRYEQQVREPFKVLVRDLITEVKKVEPAIDVEPKDCIFRINRDIRFSKDKTPYKLHTGAVIAPGGRKDMVNPGLYIELNPEHMRIYSGVYMPDKNLLYAIRERMATNPEQFAKLLKAKSFKTHFRGEILGDKNKVLPKEFKQAAEQQPLIFNKAFYYYNELDPTTCLQDDVVKICVDHFKAARPMNAFLMGA